MNNNEDPVILGKSYTPKNILITCHEHLLAIYDELMNLSPVKFFLDFLEPELGKQREIFAYDQKAVCKSMSTLLSFSQEILEWALVYEIACRPEIEPNDFILRDGHLRSLNIEQKYLIKLGKLLTQKKVVLVSITKNTPIKMELSYTLKQINV